MKKLALKLLTTLALFGLGLSNLHAFQIDRVTDLYNAASGLYATGDDNNYLAYKVMNNLEFADAYGREVSAVTEESFKEDLKECLFYKKGAYGDHLSLEKQLQLVDIFAYDVLASFKGKIMRLDGAFLLDDSAIFSSGCAMVFTLNQEVLVMQASAMD